MALCVAHLAQSVSSIPAQIVRALAGHADAAVHPFACQPNSSCQEAGQGPGGHVEKEEHEVQILWEAGQLQGRGRKWREQQRRPPGRDGLIDQRGVAYKDF